MTLLDWINRLRSRLAGSSRSASGVAPDRERERLAAARTFDLEVQKAKRTPRGF